MEVGIKLVFDTEAEAKAWLKRAAWKVLQAFGLDIPEPSEDDDEEEDEDEDSPKEAGP